VSTIIFASPDNVSVVCAKKGFSRNKKNRPERELNFMMLRIYVFLFTSPDQCIKIVFDGQITQFITKVVNLARFGGVGVSVKIEIKTTF
jgi:hypothetical protein